MTKRLQSVELSLFGVSRTFEFDPAVPVQGEDESEVGVEVLSEVESQEVTLISGGPYNGRVSIEFTITGYVEVELEDLEEGNFESNYDIEQAVQSGDFYHVYDEITEAVRNGDADVSIDGVNVVELFDEDGNDFEF